MKILNHLPALVIPLYPTVALKKWNYSNVDKTSGMYTAKLLCNVKIVVPRNTRIKKS